MRLPTRFIVYIWRYPCFKMLRKYAFYAGTQKVHRYLYYHIMLGIFNHWKSPLNLLFPSSENVSNLHLRIEWEEEKKHAYMQVRLSCTQECTLYIYRFWIICPNIMPYFCMRYVLNVKLLGTFFILWKLVRPIISNNVYLYLNSKAHNQRDRKSLLSYRKFCPPSGKMKLIFIFGYSKNIRRSN